MGEAKLIVSSGFAVRKYRISLAEKIMSSYRVKTGTDIGVGTPFWSPFCCHLSTIVVFQGSIQRASEKSSKKCLFGPGQTSKTKPQPGREHDLQVLIKFRKSLIFGFFWNLSLELFGVIM